MPKQIVLKRKFVITAIASVVFIIVVVVIYTQLNSADQLKNRDLQRLADIRTVQSIFEVIYSKEYTYESIANTGCVEGKLISQCLLYEYYPQIETIVDPGQYSYIVSKTPNKIGYGITFYLEEGNDEFGPGEHQLTELGIQ